MNYPSPFSLNNESVFIIADGLLWQNNLLNIWTNRLRPGTLPQDFLIWEPSVLLDNRYIIVVRSDQRAASYDVASNIWINLPDIPNSILVNTVPSAGMWNNSFFVGGDNGNLYQFIFNDDFSSGSWFDHGRPPNTQVPGRYSLIALFDGKLFFNGSNGHLIERWDNNGNWQWADHGKPTVSKVLGFNITSDCIYSPGGQAAGSKLFVTTKSGHLVERIYVSNNWVWFNHGKPLNGQNADSTPISLRDGKIFLKGRNGSNTSLVERFWNGNSNSWNWADHGSPNLFPGNENIFDAAGGQTTNPDSIYFVGIRQNLSNVLYRRRWDDFSGSWVFEVHGGGPWPL